MTRKEIELDEQMRCQQKDCGGRRAKGRNEMDRYIGTKIVLAEIALVRG